MVPPSSPQATAKGSTSFPSSPRVLFVRGRVGAGTTVSALYSAVPPPLRAKAAAKAARPFFRRCFLIASTTHQINEDIRDREVRLIGANGAQLGVMSAAEAQRCADDAGLDLVKISPNAVPPVCKLMDYGKFKFEQAKRDKEAKKNQHVVEIKEIRMSPGIDTGDFNVKLRNAQKFLAEGNRVKVTVRFRGREMAHTDIGKRLLLDFAAQCAEMASLDKEPKLDGRHMSIFLSAKTTKPISTKQ